MDETKIETQGVGNKSRGGENGIYKKSNISVPKRKNHAPRVPPHTVAPPYVVAPMNWAEGQMVGWPG